MVDQSSVTTGNWGRHAFESTDKAISKEDNSKVLRKQDKSITVVHCMIIICVHTLHGNPTQTSLNITELECLHNIIILE